MNNDHVTGPKILMVHNLFSPKRRSSASATPTTSGSDVTAKGSPTKIRRGRNWVRRSMSSSNLPSTPTKGKAPFLGENETVQEQAEGGKDTETQVQGNEQSEESAPGLFYAYARRSDHAAFSRYILTFSSASVCKTWFSLLESEFAEAEPRRESAQLFSFKGDDVPGQAWKHKNFEDIKNKWFYTQIGDASGTNGRPQSILPVMDARGNMVGAGAGRLAKEEEPTNGRDGRFAGEDEARSNKFDFERLESSLGKITELLETTATKNAELETKTESQAEIIEKLTEALQQSSEQIKSLSEGQQRLMDACEELRKAAKEREDIWEKMSVIGSGASTGSCGHDVRRPPRKVGRKVIGYVYGDRENGIVESIRE